MCRFILALFLAFSPAAPGLASDDRLARLMSVDFARQAERHLASCDRGNALIAALRGLPEDPNDEDFERFDQAALLMFRAVASRAIRIEGEGTHNVAFSPNGMRVAVVGFGGSGWDDDPVPGTNAPPALYDAQIGARVAALLAPELAFAPSIQNARPPHFSPDGALVGVLGLMDSRIHFFDGMTGAPVRVLAPAAPVDTGYGVMAQDLGFSPDGARYALFAENVLTVWDVASGAVLATYRVERGGAEFRWPWGWTHDGAILVHGMAAPPRAGDFTSRAWIEIWRDGRTEATFDIPNTAGEGHGWGVGDISRAGPQKITAVNGRQVLWDWETGAMQAFPNVFGAVAFTRGGDAVVSVTESGMSTGTEGIKVFDLQGNPLAPEPHDYLLLDQLVCDLEGNNIGAYYPDAAAPTYAAADVPTGKALYDWVWANVPEEVRAAVSADRVVRP